MSASINYNKFIKKMRRLGFQGPYSGGKHLFMRRGKIDIVVPNPHKRKDIGAGLLARILRQAGVDQEEFKQV